MSQLLDVEHQSDRRYMYASRLCPQASAEWSTRRNAAPVSSTAASPLSAHFRLILRRCWSAHPDSTLGRISIALKLPSVYSSTSNNMRRGPFKWKYGKGIVQQDHLSPAGRKLEDIRRRLAKEAALRRIRDSDDGIMTSEPGSPKPREVTSCVPSILPPCSLPHRHSWRETDHFSQVQCLMKRCSKEGKIMRGRIAKCKGCGTQACRACKHADVTLNDQDAGQHHRTR